MTNYKKLERLAIAQEEEIVSASFGDGKLPLAWMAMFLAQHGTKIADAIGEIDWIDEDRDLEKEIRRLVEEIWACVEREEE